jgi:hypothetical protein
MSIWKQQRVDTGTNISQLIDTKEMFTKVNSEIEASRFKLDYKVFYGENMDTEIRHTMLAFINNNYIRSDTMKLVYTEEILSYYLVNSILIQFHPKGNPHIIAGIIIGKFSELYVDGKDLEAIEVNFLVLNDKLRTMHITPYMKAVLTRESIIRYKERNFCVAYYTVGADIKCPSYGKKQLFHRPVNIRNLVRGGFLSEPVQQHVSIYNSFTGLLPMKYSCGSPNPELAKELEAKLYEYSKKTYTIFDKKTYADISRILENKSFHNFEFRDGSGNLTDFINLYNIDIYNDATRMAFKDGRIYVIFLSNNEPEHVYQIMETIAAYCYRENITDIFSICDILHIGEYHAQLKFIPGGGFLNYYMFNINMIPIENHRNGLMTI